MLRKAPKLPSWLPWSGKGLGALAVRGAVWSAIGTFGAQALRLGSNMILTRLLFPEAFGLMALVQTCMGALYLFSDVGIGPAIVQNKKGEEPRFLDTAWTLQIIRGLILFAGTAALAWPASWFFEQPMLAQLLPVVGISAIIGGFRPTKQSVAQRQLNLARLTVVNLIGQVANITCIVLLAWWWRSVWALAVGNVVGAIVTQAAIHVGIPGRRNRLRWDPVAGADLFKFGRWVLLGTAGSYLVGEGTRLIQGKLLAVETLGILAVAANLAWALGMLVKTVESQVLFPVYSRLNERDIDVLSSRVLKARRLVLAAALPGFATLMFLGPVIVGWLYDDRYSSAGRYLSIMSGNAAISTILMQYGSAILARGDARSQTLLMLVQAGLRLTGCYVGYQLGGVEGMLIATGAGTLLSYPAYARAAARHGVLHVKLDGMALALVIGLYLCVVRIHL